jgi:hypothetical protein
MMFHPSLARYFALMTAFAGLLSFSAVAKAEDSAMGESSFFKKADPSEKADGTLGPAAKAAMEHGPLPFSKATAAAKAAADRASEEAEKKGAQRPFSPADLAMAGGPGGGPLAPLIVAGFNKPGLSPGASPCGTPPDTTGTIGPKTYIQLVNCRAGLFNRTTGALIASGTLNELADIPSTVVSFDPQIIWDPTTNRFYYVMDSVFSANDNRLSFGFSREDNPKNVTADWCHYTLSFGSRFPDFPKLGDSQFFAIIGVNSFGASDNFLGSDLIAISKPPSGTACPPVTAFKIGKKINLVDSSRQQVFTPVPANQIDTNATGYAVAVNGALPAAKLWFFNVTRNAATGAPVFGAARGLTVPSYTFPPNARQPVFPQLLDTSDARNTQAVQAIDPVQSNKFAFWTQHTIKDGTASAVRWYEIDPVPAVPALLRSGTLSLPGTFLFNAAISPDRRVEGINKAFGGSFVIEYSASSKVLNTSPRIIGGSSVNGGALSFLLVKDGVGPYRDISCIAPNDLICRWGDYSAASPDPKPNATGSGVVWGTNQFSGEVNPPSNGINWRTQIFAVKP